MQNRWCIKSILYYYTDTGFQFLLLINISQWSFSRRDVSVSCCTVRFLLAIYYSFSLTAFLLPRYYLPSVDFTGDLEKRSRPYPFSRTSVKAAASGVLISLLCPSPLVGTGFESSKIGAPLSKPFGWAERRRNAKSSLRRIYLSILLQGNARSTCWWLRMKDS